VTFERQRRDVGLVGDDEALEQQDGLEFDLACSTHGRARGSMELERRRRVELPEVRPCWPY
jgi:hypothetical protein